MHYKFPLLYLYIYLHIFLYVVAGIESHSNNKFFQLKKKHYTSLLIQG